MLVRVTALIFICLQIWQASAARTCRTIDVKDWIKTRAFNATRIGSRSQVDSHYSRNALDNDASTYYKSEDTRNEWLWVRMKFPVFLLNLGFYTNSGILDLRVFVTNQEKKPMEDLKWIMRRMHEVCTVGSCSTWPTSFYERSRPKHCIKLSPKKVYLARQIFVLQKKECKSQMNIRDTDIQLMEKPVLEIEDGKVRMSCQPAKHTGLSLRWQSRKSIDDAWKVEYGDWKDEIPVKSGWLQSVQVSDGIAETYSLDAPIPPPPTTTTPPSTTPPPPAKSSGVKSGSTNVGMIIGIVVAFIVIIIVIIVVVVVCRRKQKYEGVKQRENEEEERRSDN